MNEFPKDIFRSYDIRGLLAEVTSEVARQAGMALVMKTGAKTVVVGRDMRSTSPELQQAAIEGITSMGANVIDIGMCSTSMYNFAISSQEHVQAGLMVTASHNPPEYNGIKMAYHSGRPIPGVEIYQLLPVEAPSGIIVGSVSSQDVLATYLDRCLSLANLPDVSGSKIVVDYGNGIGAVSVRPLAQRLGLQLIELYPEPDARFPNHEPNPAIEANLTALKQTIVREQADFGIALDGDADRIGFVDNEGQALRGDQMLALIAKDVLSQSPKARVILAPNQSWISGEVVRQHCGEPVEVQIGRTFVIGAMHDYEAEIGGEVSGHFFFREMGGLESVDFALANVLGIWKRSGQTFAQLTIEVQKYANSWEVNFEVHDKQKILNALEEKYTHTATLTKKIDGIRCEFNHDWWFIVRPSNTEPLIRLIVEATSEALMREKLEEIVAFIKENA